MIPPAIALLLLLALPAAAQPQALPAVDPSVQSATPANDRPRDSAQTGPRQAPGVAAGSPEVQSAAPEVGAGRGDAPNAQQPATSDPAPATGQARPDQPPVAQPRAPTPVQPIPAGPPLAARGNADAGDIELQHALRGGVIEGRVSIPNQSAGILIQPEGRDWRRFRTGILSWAGVVFILGTVVALGAFYLLRGRTRIDSGRSGRRVARFNALERGTHWMVATSFILLALTGLNITYGVYLLRPLIGAEAFTSLTLWGQVLHHYFAFAFLLGVLVMLVHWARENVPRRVDLDWIKAGGPLSKHHPPAGKFNAGQKLLYWFSVLGGILISVSGLLLMMPGLLDDVIAQQWAHIAHGLLAMGMIAVILGHIYIGTIGMEGAFEAMSDGTVDYNWAREHHSLWLREELDKARSTAAAE
jgi:formate dehydrogenase subunit gamma